MKRFLLILLTVFAGFGLTACSNKDSDSSSQQDAKYTVTFSVDGSVEEVVSDVLNGTTVKLPTDPSKEGYVFNGWFVNGVEFTTETKVTSNLIVTAEFLGLFNVTFLIENEEYEGLNSIDDLEEENNDTEDLEEENDDVEDLEDENNDTEDETETPEEVSPYIVVLSYEEVLEGTTVELPETNPTKEGYVFVGWFANGVKFTEETKVTSDLELIAVFTDSYTITFSIEGADDIVITDVIAGDKINLPANPEVAGFVFKGWFIGENEVTSAIEIVDGDVVVTAKFAELFTVSFYDDENGELVLTYEVEDDSRIVLPTENPTREGYEFAGWITTKGWGVTIVSTISEDTVIYALWLEIVSE